MRPPRAGPGWTARELLGVARGHGWHFSPSWACTPPAPALLGAPGGVGAFPSGVRFLGLRPGGSLCASRISFLPILQEGARMFMSLDWTRSSRSGQRRAKSETPDFGLGMPRWSRVLGPTDPAAPSSWNIPASRGLGRFFHEHLFQVRGRDLIERTVLAKQRVRASVHPGMHACLRTHTCTRSVHGHWSPKLGGRIMGESAACEHARAGNRSTLCYSSE